jgi:hypothetical protein
VFGCKKPTTCCSLPFKQWAAKEAYLGLEMSLILLCLHCTHEGTIRGGGITVPSSLNIYPEACCGKEWGNTFSAPSQGINLLYNYGLLIPNYSISLKDDVTMILLSGVNSMQ